MSVLPPPADPAGFAMVTAVEEARERLVTTPSSSPVYSAYQTQTRQLLTEYIDTYMSKGWLTPGNIFDAINNIDTQVLVLGGSAAGWIIELWGGTLPPASTTNGTTGGYAFRQTAEN
jgi:hypothetical protein